MFYLCTTQLYTVDFFRIPFYTVHKRVYLYRRQKYGDNWTARLYFATLSYHVIHCTLNGNSTVRVNTCTNLSSWSETKVSLFAAIPYPSKLQLLNVRASAIVSILSFAIRAGGIKARASQQRVKKRFKENNFVREALLTLWSINRGFRKFWRIALCRQTRAHASFYLRVQPSRGEKRWISTSTTWKTDAQT